MVTQRQLIRRYFLVSFLVLAGGLMASGLVEMYFRYQEIRENIGRLQQEAASNAAAKVGLSMQEIFSSMVAATRSRDVASTSPGFRDGPLRKLFDDMLSGELNRLLLIAAITEAIALDADGAARARASRLRPVHPEDKRDFADSIGFQRAIGGERHVGPIHFVRGSEPYVTLSVPIEILAGVTVGVLQAEVSLIYVGEQVVAQLEASDTGYAYIVSRSGQLVAHPQVGLVLERRDLSSLEQVAQALRADPAGAGGTLGTLGRNMRGERVFSSYAPVPDLDWIVFIERPADEVYRPLYASIRRTVVLLLVGLGMALVVSILLARRILRPLETLRQGVQRVGQGDLAFRLPVGSGDELATLAEEFNRMSERLQEAYTGLEHKVAERTQELVTLNQQLDQANRLKSQFLANVSHEFRTPMNAIIGFTRLVMRKTEAQIPPLQHANLQKVLISAEHLLALINGLLDLSKIEAGRMEVYPVRFDLRELIHGTAATIEPMLKADRVTLVTEVADDLPPLFTDRDKLRQILMNLLSNAAKFTDEGVITVSAARADDTLRLRVSDTGIGMPAEALEYIFEEFRQVDMSSTRRHGGTGLGLAIVRRLARLLGGQVVADSELGKGSTFVLTLPLALERASTRAGA
jgi:signal transduction histidine kinase